MPADRTDGGFDDNVHRFAVTVYFEDTDLSGVVYHANYLRYMERARSEMLADAGIDQRAAWEARTGVYAIRSLDIVYHAPARLGDRLVVESRLAGHGAAFARVHQRVIRDDALLTEAKVVAAFVSSEGRPTRQPRAWIEIFERLKTGSPRAPQ